MKNSELISVVIPTYNRSATLKRAIDSVLNQTYGNIEIIVVDDNAQLPEFREHNRKLIQSYEREIVFLENTANLGGGLSRNEGIKAARGRYIAFLDDDDEYLPDKIEAQYNYFIAQNNPNLAMVYCYAEMIRVDGSSYLFKKDLEGCYLLENVRECIAATSWWFCSKQKLEAVGAFEDIGSRQDASLIMKFFVHGFDVARVPEVLLKYYWHDSAHGISKNNLKSVSAEKQYRDIFIRESKILTEEKVINEVLYIFNFRIAMQYILIGDRKNAYSEYINMKKLDKTITIKSARTLFGVIFNKTYRFISRQRNHQVE